MFYDRASFDGQYQLEEKISIATFRASSETKGEKLPTKRISCLTDINNALLVIGLKSIYSFCCKMLCRSIYHQLKDF